MDDQKLIPFAPHPDGRLVAAEYVPCLNASDLAWSGIIARGAEGEMWPFDELKDFSEWLAERGHDTPVLELEKLRCEGRGPDEVRLIAIFTTWSPSWPDCKSDSNWREFHLVRTRPHFGGERWWFKCPKCETLRAYIYLVPCVYSLCRECQGLTYVSRQEFNRVSRHGRGFRNFKYKMDRLLKRASSNDRQKERRRQANLRHMYAGQANVPTG